MTPPSTAQNPPATPPGEVPANERSPETPPVSAKFGRIFEEEEGEFSLEYDDTRGQKNTMRLDAFTYEGSIREARSYLGIQEGDRDEEGNHWTVE